MREKLALFNSKAGKKLKNFFTPTRYILFGFLAVIITGTILLVLPFSSADGKSMGFVNALFMSTSSVCVTGLTTVDVGSQVSLFGQIVILFLIQIGGLGFMTTTTLMFMLIGKKISLRERVTIQESLSQDSMKGVVRTTRNIICFTFIIEGLGALMLMTRFIPYMGAKGIYVALFTAVSSFCNAGIDVMGGVTGPGTSLSGFANDPVVIVTVGVLIICGGLGFLVFNDIFRKRRNKPLSLHTRVSLWMTLILTLAGATVFLALEFNNPATLGPLSTGNKILNALFQSTTTRTAGYFSIYQGDVYDGSKVATMILMFIGACPASTGGGVKTTTVFVMILLIVSVFRDKDDIVYRKETIGNKTIRRAAAVMIFSFCAALAQAIIMWGVEKPYNPGFGLVDCVFESISAFGTVGLSTGITESLHIASKLTLCLTMLIGRLGPITIGMAIMRSSRNTPKIKYPDAKILIG